MKIESAVFELSAAAEFAHFVVGKPQHNKVQANQQSDEAAHADKENIGLSGVGGKRHKGLGDGGIQIDVCAGNA